MLGVGGVLLIIPNADIKPDTAAVNDALRNGGDAVDIVRTAYEDMNGRVNTTLSGIRAIVCAYFGIIAALGIGFCLYCEYGVLKPFRRLRGFTRNIASGNLDIPLEADRRGAFGEFIESFDIMREELKKARENERAADRSKKELVAQLSHDIKTPVASIKAAIELMLISADGGNKARLEMINAKADQINALITDMFHSTLEELHALTANAAEIAGSDVAKAIRTADYKGKVKPFAVPDCIVVADIIRLRQVFDNIIGNSYKYADTDIEIRSYIDKNALIIETADFGGGVAFEELPLVANKFYRGKNAAEHNGYGLGLYISKNLMNLMNGELVCENRESGGFAVKVVLKLA